MTLRALSTAFVLTGSLLAGCGGDDGNTPPPECKVSGEACTWLGVPDKIGFTKDGGDRLDTTIYWSMDTLFASTGETYFIDWNNHIVRKIGTDKKIHTVVGWNDPVFPGDGDLGAPTLEKTPDGDLGTNVQLNHPTDLYEKPDGMILLMAWHNHKLRQYDPSTGNVRILGGAGAGYVDGPLPMAVFKQPSRLALDEASNIYILDQGNGRIRKVDAATNMVSTIAGNGKHEFAGDGGPALMAGFAWETGDNPEPSGGIAYANNTLYIADTDNNRIRKMDLGTGVVTTIAGTGNGGFSGDGGAGTSAELRGPRDLELGPDGNLYIADTDNSAVRMLDLGTGTITTVAGTGENGFEDVEAVQATTMHLHRPFGIDFDQQGYLYVNDSLNSRILRVNP